MPDHQNMFDLKHINGELEHRQAVKVRMHNHVGHVPVNKQLTGQQIDNLVGRHTAVRTANPEIFRCLLVGQAVEKLGVLGLDAIGPGPVFFQKMVKLTHYLTPF